MTLRRFILALFALVMIPAGPTFAQDLGNLVESKRDCAICHLEWSSDFAKPDAVLLIDKPKISMASRESTCLGCHDGSVRDSRKKVWQEQSHKTGITPPKTMQIPVGLPLEDGKLACRTCHTAHNVPGAEDLSSTFFLRIENDQSQLCRACHDEKGTGPTHGSHPIGAMTVGFPNELIKAGAKSGPKGSEVICQSCHGAHGTKVNKLLVLPITDNQLCLSCHDKLKPGALTGPTAHGHPTRAPLSTDAQRQAVVDLKTHLGKDSTLACLTCHRLHDGQPDEHLLADTLKDSRLCIRCHPVNATVVSTKHDLRISAPTTRNALDQTAEKSGPCSACHIPHQSSTDLVAMPGDPTGDCMKCHAQGKVAAGAGAQHFLHPQQVAPDRVAVSSGLVVTVDRDHPDRADITCKTCHNPHNATKPKFLRNDPDQVCGTCHADQFTTLAGSHDFTTHPQVRNRLNQTADQSGRCGFCHNVHQGSGPAMWIATTSTPTTAAALCLECHTTDGLAKDHPAPKFSHPTGIKPKSDRPLPLPLFTPAGVRTTTDGLVQCASCHNPHANSTQSKQMLRVKGTTSDLCLTCHDDKATLAGSIHDSKTNTRWPSTPAGNDMCMGCHRAHGNDADKTLWAVTPISGVAPADGVCIACHKQNAWASTDAEPTAGNMLHPQTLPTTRPEPGSGHTVTVTIATSPLPLVRPIGSDIRTQIGCSTCHNPHASRQTPSLLRTPDPTSPQQLCFQCHSNESGLGNSMHSRDQLAKGGALASQSTAEAKMVCAPCHAVHATGSSVKEKLWAGKLDDSAATPNEQRCLGCHDNQTAKRPNIPEHPAVVFDILKLTNRPVHTDGYLPTERSIPCSTCHLAHGQTTTPAQSVGDGTVTYRRAEKIMLRSQVPAELCSTCHGPDAARVFLYYHHPEQRRDPQTQQSPNATH
jgi:predicted CXXCH cytochrome family protein